MSPAPFLPVSPRLSTILCKFAHKFFFVRVSPPGGYHPGHLGQSTPPSDATVCRYYPTSIRSLLIMLCYGCSHMLKPHLLLCFCPHSAQHTSPFMQTFFVDDPQRHNLHSNEKLTAALTNRTVSMTFPSHNGQVPQYWSTVQNLTSF